MPDRDALECDLGAGYVLVAAGIRRERSGHLTADLILQNGRPLFARRVDFSDPASCGAWAVQAHAEGRPSTDSITAGILSLLPGALAMTQEPEKRPTQADQLVALVVESAGARLFHDADGLPYLDLERDGHREIWPLRSQDTRDILARLAYEHTRKVPGSQATQDALNVLAGTAKFGSPEVRVSVRIAAHDGAVYLDLGNGAWEVIEITASGRRIIAGHEAPVRFRRPKGQLPLPVPQVGGTLRSLEDFLGLDDAQFRLVAGWLLGFFLDRGGRPILELIGEQGAGKSLLAAFLRFLLDPNVAPLRSQPREETDLIIAAQNSAIVGLDNLSSIPGWLSDAVCRLATGAAISRRQLYSDADEVILAAQRQLVLTGITPVLTRSDALDRALTVPLDPMPEGKRRTEASFWEEAETIRPIVLGALLDAVSGGLACLDSTNPARLPRLADFGRWVEACAPALGWPPSAFLDAMSANRGDADETAVEETLVGPAIRRFMEGRDEWEGNATQLLAELTERMTSQAEETIKKSRDWPKQGNGLSKLLRRIAPNLRRLGIELRFGKSSDGNSRVITLTNSAKNTGANDRPDRPGSSEAELASTATTAEDQPYGDPWVWVTDDADDPDDGLHRYSIEDRGDDHWQELLFE